MKKFQVYSTQTVLVVTKIEAENESEALDLLESAEWKELLRENNKIEIKEI